METESLLVLGMFVCLFAFIMTGIPVAFALSGVALVFALIAYSFDLFYLTDFGFIPSRIWGVMQNFTLMAVPLFIFMGITLEKSGIAAELLSTMAQVLKRIKGSLGLTVVLVGGILAASTGIVGATVVTLGVLALPTLLKHGYPKDLATGVIAASGTLGQIIPPSIVLVILGDIMGIDVGDLFTAAIGPGCVLILGYLSYVFLRSRWSGSGKRGEDLPLAEEGDEVPLTMSQKLFAILGPIGLMVIVLGSILSGLASPTEAAACGAVGAIGIALGKGKLSRSVVMEVGQQTSMITAMVFTLLIGAQFFGVVFRAVGGDYLIEDLIVNSQFGPDTILFGVMVLVFVLGFF